MSWAPDWISWFVRGRSDFSSSSRFTHYLVFHFKDMLLSPAYASEVLKKKKNVLHVIPLCRPGQVANWVTVSETGGVGDSSALCWYEAFRVGSWAKKKRVWAQCCGLFPVSYKWKGHRLYGASVDVPECNADKGFTRLFITQVSTKDVFSDSGLRDNWALDAQLQKVRNASEISVYWSDCFQIKTSRIICCICLNLKVWEC